MLNMVNKVHFDNPSQSSNPFCTFVYIPDQVLVSEIEIHERSKRTDYGMILLHQDHG
jgi:hypothetical protein